MQKILIVDDQVTNRTLLKGILHQANEGYELLEAGSGQGALEAVQKDKPHLILLDVLMPDINGFDVCTRLKADPKTNAIPVIFITALENSEDKIRGLEVGGSDYITKPINADEVISRVASHLKILNAKKGKLKFKIKNKIGIFLGLLLLFYTAALLSVSTILIDKIILNNEKSNLLLELNGVLQNTEQSYNVLVRLGLDKVDNYVQQAKNDMIKTFGQRSVDKSAKLHVVGEDEKDVLNDHTEKDIDESLIRRMRREKQGSVEFSSDEGRQFAVFKVFSQWDWIFVLAVPENQMYRDRNAYLMKVSLIALLVFVIGGLIGLI